MQTGLLGTLSKKFMPVVPSSPVQTCHVPVPKWAVVHTQEPQTHLQTQEKPIWSPETIHTPGESGFHTFRHSAASILNERTGNLKLTQKLLGHSNISTTADGYTHISEETEREAALTVEEAICGGFVPNLFPTGNKTDNAAVN